VEDGVWVAVGDAVGSNDNDDEALLDWLIISVNDPPVGVTDFVMLGERDSLDSECSWESECLETVALCDAVRSRETLWDIDNERPSLDQLDVVDWDAVCETVSDSVRERLMSREGVPRVAVGDAARFMDGVRGPTVFVSLAEVMPDKDRESLVEPDLEPESVNVDERDADCIVLVGCRVLEFLEVNETDCVAVPIDCDLLSDPTSERLRSLMEGDADNEREGVSDCVDESADESDGDGTSFVRVGSEVEFVSDGPP
jgi:hypothetical protein